MSTKVVQVTNIAPQATKDQMQNLFGCIGKIDEIRLYPTVRDVTCPVVSRICYVKFFESSCVAVAQHLTNTVFIDRALIVCPVSGGVIPDEFKALEITNNGAAVPGLPASDSSLPSEVVNRIEGVHPYQVVKTFDPKLEEYNLPEYPPLPVNFDARKIEEIRRTIIVIDVPADWELDEILTHFARAGEVKYARFAEKSRQKHVMIEFCEQKSVTEALKLQGTEFLGKRLNIFHSMQSIIKPEAKSNEAAQREIEEAMSIVKEAQNMISAAIDPVIGILSSKEKPVVVPPRRTRTRSPSRSRSRSKRSKSRKRSRRSRSRSRSKRSKRSRSRRRSRSSSAPRRSKRSRSRSKRPHSRERERRKRSRSRRRSRSPSAQQPRRRSRTRSRERKKSRSPHSSSSRRKTSRKEEKRSRRSRSRSKSKSRRHSKSRSTHTSSSSTYRRNKTARNEAPDRRTKTKSTRDYDAEEKIGTEDLKKSSSDRSPDKSDNMDMDISP